MTKESHHFVEDDAMSNEELDLTTNCGKLPEFNLSEEAIREGDYAGSEDDEVFRKQEVKEFIKLLKAEIKAGFFNQTPSFTPDVEDLYEMIDKLVGKDLI